jgi:hypothetical protein
MRLSRYEEEIRVAPKESGKYIPALSFRNSELFQSSSLICVLMDSVAQIFEEGVIPFSLDLHVTGNGLHGSAIRLA